MSRRGKQGDDRYTSISARIPRDLRRAVKHKQIDTDLTLDDLLEHFLALWVKGEVSSPEAATPQPLPGAIKYKRRTVKASPPDKQASPTEVALIVASLDISQNEAARRINVSPQTLSRYANGHRTCPPEVLEALKQLQKDSI